MLRAGELAGLTVLQLMNDNAAGACEGGTEQFVEGEDRRGGFTFATRLGQ